MWPEEEDWAQLLSLFIQKERVKYWRKTLKLITVYDNVKTNILVFKDNFFSFDIQRYVVDDQAYDNLSGKKSW
jgi:hypothetical protein